MIGLPNPYVLLGGGVAALAIAGSMYVQSTMIHKYHTMYLSDETTIVQLKDKIRGMTDTQNTQTGKSEQNVIRVIQGPKEIMSVIHEIQAAPAKPCAAPVYSEEVKNDF